MTREKTKSFRTTLTIIYLLSAILMVIRVDWWWWGSKIDPLIAGWLTIPMIYQIGIWLAGIGLIFWLCIGVWAKQNEGDNNER